MSEPIAKKISFIEIAGDSLVLAFAFFNDAAQTQATDVTGWTLRTTLKTQATDLDAAAVYDATVGPTGAPALGQFTVTLAAATTQPFAGQTLYLRCRVIQADGSVFTEVYGPVRWQEA
jgi:hypothetical protein